MANSMDIRTDFGGGDDFGHADYRAAREYGISNSRIRDFLDANPSKLIGKNTAGGGGLYDEIVDAGRARDFRGTDTPRINSKYGWVGNTNAFNPDAAYGPIEEPVETTNTNTLDEELDQQQTSESYLEKFRDKVLSGLNQSQDMYTDQENDMDIDADQENDMDIDSVYKAKKGVFNNKFLDDRDIINSFNVIDSYNRDYGGFTNTQVGGDGSVSYNAQFFQ